MSAMRESSASTYSELIPQSYNLQLAGQLAGCQLAALSAPL